MQRAAGAAASLAGRSARAADNRPISTQSPLMNLHLSLTPVISLVAGILILVMPKLLNVIVAIYLIAIGVIGLLGPGVLHLR